jgi:hypothetical protein
VPVDTHVHFHRLALAGPTLESAAANFAAVSPGHSKLTGMVLLTEAARERVFGPLATVGQAGAWRIAPAAGETQTLIAESRGRRIAIVCGRQVRCELKLEVLALGTTAEFPDGRSLDETITAVRSEGALAVLPWGFGKWTGQAGKVIREALSRWPAEKVYGGDNGGRMQLQGRPDLLREAERRGFRILPGTDPFPFGADYRRVGAFGLLAPIDPDPAAPWQSLRNWLEAGEGRPEPYGRALNPLRFVFNQGWIQVHNRMRPKAAA